MPADQQTPKWYEAPLREGEYDVPVFIRLTAESAQAAREQGQRIAKDISEGRGERYILAMWAPGEGGGEAAYQVEKQYDGLYYVMGTEEGERVASVGQFMPGPMVSYEAPKITPPALARVIASAMIQLADDIEAGER